MKVHSLAAITLLYCINASLAANDRLDSPNKAVDDKVVQKPHHFDDRREKKSPCREWDDQTAYEALSAKRKEDCIMKMVKATKGKRMTYLDNDAFVESVQSRDLNLAFGPGEKLPYDMKNIHSVGFVAAIELESVVDNPYTGKFS